MQPSEQPQHPIDYLDSISTAPKKRPGAVNDKLFFGALIAGAISILLVGSLIFLNGGTSSKEDMARLSTRLQNLQKISDDARETVVSSELRATNINLALTLANANHDIVEPLKTYGLEPKKIDKKITTEEDPKELTDKLEDARLNAIFDRTYAREMTYELGTLLILIEQLQTKVEDSDQQEFLSTLRTNIEPLQKQFDTFGSS